MDKLKHERIKDVIIDFLFDYSYNDKVIIFESDGNILTLHPGVKLEDDPLTSTVFENMKNGKSIKMSYGARQKETCELISEDGKVTHSDLLVRLERLGIEKSEELGCNIKDAIQYLCDRSYLKRDQPLINNVGLTSKGLKHYESGKSFEDDFVKNNILLKSDKRSRQSKIIAIISLFISALIGIVGLILKYK